MARIPLVLALCCAACAQVPVPPLPENELRALQACRSAGECVRVVNGCCDCANGGETVAVHRKFEATLRARFDCAKTLCAGKVGDCQFREPECVRGLCTLGPQRRWQDKR